MNEAELSPFKNGHWIWDHKNNKLVFASKDVVDKTPSLLSNMTDAKVKIVPAKQAPNQIRFKDTYDGMDMIRFRRYFQRKCKNFEPEVITIQDIKDVVLYSTNPKDLSPEFILYFHMPVMDRVLRALIIYFQYYIQTWEYMVAKREEARRKLRQPIVDVLEDRTSQELADLRSMVAREYMSLVLGVGEARPFHHMKNTENMSLSDKDRRLFETWINVAVRVVWIALQRKNFSSIEIEMHRLLRTEIFNVITHRTRRMTVTLEKYPEENRILNGKSNIIESKLLQRSALIKELLHGQHDHRMLGIGIAQFEPTDRRIDYLEVAFSAPEEELHRYKITVGLLGVPRYEFDSLLVGRERTSKTFNIPITELLDFQAPEPAKHPLESFPPTYPKEPPRFTETHQTVRSRLQQKKLWYEHVSKQQI